MDLLTSFTGYIQSNQLFGRHDRLILAVSGGADSVVLADLCHRAGFHFSIAHVNYRLRAGESEADEAFVVQLAQTYSVPCAVTRFDTDAIAAEWKKGIQETARDLRYNWFRELYQAEKSKQPSGEVFVVTAHHANDQVETLLMNFFKGTGIKGLTAMAPRSGSEPPLRRPLLFCKKEDLLAYIDERALRYREDSSNSYNEYTRNYFRNILIPGIEKVYPGVKENLLNNLERFRDIRLLYDESIDQYRKKILEKEGAGWKIAVRKLLKIPARKSLLFELLRPFGFSPGQSAEALHLLTSATGKYVSSHSHRIFRNRDWLVITSLATEAATQILITDTESSIPYPGAMIQIQTKPAGGEISTDPATAQLDAEKIQFPLLLRKWRMGDYFYPFGMSKKKKISRFLVDQKLSIPQKEHVWVMESNKKIIWVVGLRIDHRFRITPQTRQVLQLNCVV